MAHIDRDEPHLPAPTATGQQTAVAARLLLTVPATTGVLLVEGLFVGHDGAQPIALTAAVLGWLMAWLGIAWALHSWVAALLTFVPALMTALGVGMLASAPISGGIILILGATMLLAIIFSRVSAPDRRWTPGWSAPGGAGFGGAGPGGTGFGDARPGSARLGGAGSDDAQDPGSWGGGPIETTGSTLVTLEQFFADHADSRSIAPGLAGAVPLGRFAAVLGALRGRDEVAEVIIQLNPPEPGAPPVGQWPRADSVRVATVRVVTAGSPQEIAAALAGLPPCDIIGPLPADTLADGSPAPADSSEFALLWR